MLLKAWRSMCDGFARHRQLEAMTRKDPEAAEWGRIGLGSGHFTPRGHRRCAEAIADTFYPATHP